MQTHVLLPTRWGYCTRLSLVLLVGCTASVRPSSRTTTPPPTPVVVVARDAPAVPEAPAVAAPARGLRPVHLAVCTPQRGAQATVLRRTHDNVAARRGAQRGLEFVAREAIAWQGQHNCYGCHVQAVTFEALTVGREHRYDVSSEQFAEVMRGLTTINGGSRGRNGLSVGGDPRHLIETSQLFGGAAFARFDASLGAELRDDLLGVAQQLKAHQNDEGSVRTTDGRFPVVAGMMQATTQALQTWHQAYARSADEQWLEPVRRAEGWMQQQARRLSDEANATQVDLNYAVLGLREAGAQPGEATLRALDARLRSRQGDDGGWSYRLGEPSNAFATGQTLYALRTLGASDGDRSIERGMRWLLEHQGSDGGWSHNGSGKAEAMWAVFGLVSLDVLSVDVAGLRDGEHASGVVQVRGRASDNSGAAVDHVDVLVDDVPLARGCGATVEHDIDLTALGAGSHTLDLVATNTQGQSSRRRVEFYTGDHYLTHLGTRFDAGVTGFSWRNVAPAAMQGQVVLRVFAPGEGAAAPRREVFRVAQPGAQGPMRSEWDGRTNDGQRVAAGRYEVEVVYVGADGRPLHTVSTPFVHDTPEAQRAAYGELSGNLQGAAGANASNATVELVDERGRVVQTASTTEQGNWRFRNVDGGNYRVRVRRAGYHGVEQRVQATPGRVAPAASMQMELAY